MTRIRPGLRVENHGGKSKKKIMAEAKDEAKHELKHRVKDEVADQIRGGYYGHPKAYSEDQAEDAVEYAFREFLRGKRYGVKLEDLVGDARLKTELKSTAK